MKFWLFTFSLLLTLTNGITFAQSQIIDKVFPNLSVEKRAQLEIVDTFVYDYMHWDNYNYYEYETSFGLDDFEFFLIYRHKELNKVGLIVYGKDNYYATDAVADSIYLIKPKDLEYLESYDDQGNYLAGYVAKSLYFGFESADKPVELWTLVATDSYEMSKTGNVKKDLFKAVEFTEVISEETGNYVTAVFANLSNNKIYNSAVLNESLVRTEVYTYRYDSYYYGEADYYYDYDSPDVDFTMPVFETRLNYEPVEIIYLMNGDTISELISYSYTESADSYSRKALPDNFSGVWTTDKESRDSELTIIDGDEIYTAYGILYGSVDSYKNAYEVGTYSFNEILGKLNLTEEEKNLMEDMWNGTKENVRYIEFTSWTYLSRFRDYYFFNGSGMMHVTFEYNADGTIKKDIYSLESEQVYEMFGTAEYDSYSYTTIIKDSNGKVIPLFDSGIEYYYNYNLSVADKNIDAEGNLILTDESIGSINFKAFSYGDNYLGQVRIQWVASTSLEDGGRIVNIKSMPFQIVDQQRNDLAGDVHSLYISNVQGFNLYQVTNKDNKAGVLGPDGKWIINQEWDAINILGPSSSYGYETVNLPVFFVVYKGTACGVLDSKGKWVVPMGQEYVEICKDQILVTASAKISVYSLDGKLLIAGIDGIGGGYYGFATDCYSFDYTNSGYRVLVKNEKYGIADENFNLVVPFEYSYMVQIASSGNYIAGNAEGKYGIIQTSSEIVLPFIYDNIVPFDYNPNRLVATKDGKQGVIDTYGSVVIPFEFYSIATYSDWGSNIIYISDPDYRTNIIDTTGKSIINVPCSFVFLYPSYGIIYCADNGKADFYNMQGELLYSKVIEYLDPYSSYENIQIYQMGSYENPRFGAFDVITGEEMMPVEFESLYPFWINEQLFFAGYKKGKVGIYSADGTELVKPKGYYLDNYYYDDGYYGGEVGYFVEISNKKGKSKVIQLNW
jgi:hypothetical protein